MNNFAQKDDISRYTIMNKFKLEAPQFVFDCDLKGKIVYIYIQHLFSKIDFNDGGRKWSFCEHHMGFFSRGDVRGWNWFVIAICEITCDFAFPNLRDCRKNTSIIEKSRANAIFAFEVFERKELAMGV